MRKINTGIIGCGGIANGKHLPALKSIDNVSIVAFCDLEEKKAKDASIKYGVKDARVYTSYAEMLASENTIETIHVLTPNDSHCEITVAALESGKHVICEKPMAKNVEEAKKMIETAKQTNNILTIGYQNRYREDSQYLKKMCENNELGEIYYAEAHALRRRAVPTWGVFLDEKAQGGGPLIDIGTHALDLTLWLMDNYEPEMVTGSVYRKLADNKNSANAWGPWDPQKYTVEDSAFAFIRFKNKATVVLKSSWALNMLDCKEASCILCGNKAGADMKDGLRINGEKYGKTYVNKPEMNIGGVDFYESDLNSPAVKEAINFYEAVTEGNELTVKPEQALIVTEILEAIYESSKNNGEPIYFDYQK